MGLPGGRGGLPAGDVEEEDEAEEGDAADGEVDPEAPAPGEGAGEGAAQEGAYDGGEAKDHAEYGWGVLVRVGMARGEGEGD